jgi:Protein of unknown function (DUF2789)
LITQDRSNQSVANTIAAITENFYTFLEIKMDTSIHTMQTLFFQLGLARDEEQIRTFIEKHRPLPRNIPLPEANFWNAAQASFLSEAIENDSDWCALVDELDSLLRENYSWID